jgi:DAK2 domain fusion protein YloV
MTDPSIERFRRIVESAYLELDSRRSEVNDLNVFPVADGDTGDNMVLTLKAVLDELDGLESQEGPDVDRSEIVEAIARAALMGARGNSGVILSQIIRGAAEELASRPGELVDPVLIAASMASAADAAYESVRDPAEGTMLTVFREMASSAAKRLAHMEQARLDGEVTAETQDQILAELLDGVVKDGEQAVARTPEQLDVLREAGVVDAGAHGLVVMIAGLVAGLRGSADAAPEVARQAPPSVGRSHHEDSRFRYCTNFIVTGRGFEARSFVPMLESIGDSVLVVGDESTLKVHVHCDEPERAMDVFSSVGEVSQLDVADMREQVAARAARLASGRSAVVAVAAGHGVRNLYENLGAMVVDGGPTFNPSIADLLAGIREVPAEEVILLPNNPNVVMAAQRAAELSDKTTVVVQCLAPQAGLAAIVEVDHDKGAEENAERVTGALAGMSIGSVARAAKDDTKGRFFTGDAVGFAGDEIVAWGGAGSTLAKTMEVLSAEAEILTVISGEGAPLGVDEAAEHAPEGIEVEIHEGGQPAWWWLLVAE